MKRKLLHVGCGSKRKDATTPAFNTPEWTEIRLDIDPSVSPDIVGTMTDMAAVGTGSVDAVFSSHNIEHLFVHEVPIAFAEFKRVLAPDGFLIVTCPDLQAVAALIAEDKLTDTAYNSPAGPIRPIDIVFGHSPSIARGNRFMAHHCGFSRKVLAATLRAAGFAKIAALRRGFPDFDLWALATKKEMESGPLGDLAAAHFPRKR